MDNYNWATDLRRLFEDGLLSYRQGRCSAQNIFSASQKDFLTSIGATPQELFDFVEDNFNGGDPTWETVLLITAVRRDYFLTVQKGVPSSQTLDMAGLPAKSAKLEGIAWLPRIIEKAHAKLRGEMPPELMYCCGGDRAFLQEHAIHPADFLREVWAAGEDRRRIIDYVKK